jgi:SAM-dependent methyltransferase
MLMEFIPRRRSLREMKRLQKQAYRNVYLRPKVFLRFFRGMNSMSMFREYVMGLWVLVKTALPGFEKRLRVQKIPRKDLARFAGGTYVDSPVYFSSNPLTRYIQWWKLDFALRYVPSGNQERMLDFGCGNGVMFPTLATRFHSVTGVDLHTTAAGRLKRDYGLDRIALVCANGMELPFKAASFQTILALSTLEHFEAVEAAVEEIHRVMKPGGHLIFLSPSENLFYRLGRKILGLQRPEDHYHTAEKIQSEIERRFSVHLTHGFPIGTLPFLSMYRLGVFGKPRWSSS